jgi:cell division protein FtsI/penicillin-binding protein 2
MIFVAKDEFGAPEVVVVVYLRFGGFGKEGAPLAAQLVAKWREIKKRMGGAKKPLVSG